MNPSLLLIPDRYKAAKLYSQIPNSGDGDLTVTRGTTAYRTNASGLLESVASGVARLDYTGGGCPSLLVEPAATNLFQRSEEFDNAYWTKIRCTVSGNTTTAPDGTLTADKLVESVDNGTHFIDRAAGTASAVETFSVYLKAAGREWAYLQLGNSNAAYFNIFGSGAIGTTIGAGTVAKIELIANGWYRCSITATRAATQINYVMTAASNGGISYLGNAVDGIFVWGAQLETGAVATSYIPTVAATVTRNADVITKTGVSGLIGQSEGTLYAEINVSKLLGTQSRYILNISDGTADNRIYLAFSGASSNILRARVWSGGVLEATIDTSTISTLGTYKLAIGYANNDIVFYLNGVQVGTDTSATIPACSNVNLGSSQGSLAQFNDRISAAAIYTTRLSNSELAQLTTL